MMKNSKLKFSKYMQNIRRSKSFGKFVLIVYKYLVNMTKHRCKKSRNAPSERVSLHCENMHYTLQFDHDFIMGQRSLWNTNLLPNNKIVCSTVKTHKKIPLLGEGYSLSFLINMFYGHLLKPEWKNLSIERNHISPL